jgi:hypothetical protein
MADPPDDEVPRPLLRDRLAEMSPDEFEQFVVETFEQTKPEVDNLVVTIHDRIAGVDGTFDFDATVRYRLGGMDFLVVVEAKRHKNPIKREVVQALHSKMTGVGAHKVVVIATAPFQRGALRFAQVHGIGLVCVTGEGVKWEMRLLTSSSMQEYSRSFREGRGGRDGGFVGQHWEYVNGTTLRTTVVTSEREHTMELLLGIPRQPPQM